MLGDCPCCGRGNCGGRRCHSCRQRAPEPRDDDPDEPWSPPGGSYRNVRWVPNYTPVGAQLHPCQPDLTMDALPDLCADLLTSARAAGFDVTTVPDDVRAAL